MEEYFKKIGLMHDENAENVESEYHQLMQMWKYGSDYPVIDVLKINGKVKSRLKNNNSIDPEK